MEHITISNVEPDKLIKFKDPRILQEMIYIKRDWKNKLTDENLYGTSNNVSFEHDSFLPVNRITQQSVSNSSSNESLIFSSSSEQNSPKLERKDISSLSAFIYENNMKQILLPPFEYCSVTMLNHAKYQNYEKNGKQIRDLVTDKGGTVKDVLQSSHSFLHCLTTYPLKNTFRAYIALSPFLPPNAIGMPLHYVREIFSLSDIDMLPMSEKQYLNVHFFAYFDLPSNISLILKRDPAIHAGSILSIERIFITREQQIDSIFISGFSLKNLNADFDGDAVTVNIIRGVEAKTEISACMNRPFLYLTKTPRYHFSQSYHYTIFRFLLTGYSNELENQIREKLKNNTTHEVVKKIFIQHLRSESSLSRAREIFNERTQFLAYYQFAAEEYNNCENNTDPIWKKSPLEYIYRSLNSSILCDSYIKNIISFLEKNTEVEINHFIQDRCIFSLENWIVYHSSSKTYNFNIENSQMACPCKNCSNCEENIKNGGKNDSENEEEEEILLCQLTNEEIEKCKNYMSDFIHISKDVPKTSYFSTNLKWFVQSCYVHNDNLFFFNDKILDNVSLYIDI